jgi:hypothetical protein
MGRKEVPVSEMIEEEFPKWRDTPLSEKWVLALHLFGFPLAVLMGTGLAMGLAWWLS